MRFYDVILPSDHVSLTLDGVTSFLRIINKKHTYTLVTVKHLAGFLKCSGRKFEESEVYDCFFIISCVLESKWISSSSELLSNNSLFIGQL